MRHPAVVAGAVVGVPDEIRGQVVKAFVDARRRDRADDGARVELQDSSGTRLAAYEYPREIEFVDELPRTVTGKILRRALVDESSSA